MAKGWNAGRITLAVGSVILAGAAAGHAELHSMAVEYHQGQTVLEGYYVYDDAFSGSRPGVVVIHDWMGLSDFTRGRADALARMGYAALAADIYGKGVRPAGPADAKELAGRYKGDRPLLRARGRAALDFLAAQPQADAARLAAMGYCFGGTAALELARSGAPLAGVVSFHGGLDTPDPSDAKRIRGKVLALHGADDPHVTADQVAAFEKEMRDAGVDWQLTKYGGAVHAFAVPSAGTDTAKGAAYNAAADRRSWQAMKDFFAEIFQPVAASPPPPKGSAAATAAAPPAGPNTYTGPQLDNALQHLTRGMQVTATLAGGERVSGRFQDYAESTVTLRTPKTRRIKRADLVAIDAPGSR
jgi:dienelactone hydrolase